jgi:hypothetical protein
LQSFAATPANLSHPSPEIPREELATERSTIFEVDFHPLSIWKISPILVKVTDDPDMKPYVLQLQQVILKRLF